MSSQAAALQARDWKGHGAWDLLRRRTTMRDRIEALPRQEPTAIRRKRAATCKRYRARAARITAAQMKAVRERDQSCRTCGSPGTDFDHILAVALGGQTTLENLQLLCHPCHVQKSRSDRSLAARHRKEVMPHGSQPSSGRVASRDPARTSPSQASDGAWSRALVPASPMPSSLWPSDTDLGSSSSRTFRDFSPVMEGETWRRSSVRWSNSGMAWDTGCSTLATSECRSADGECSSSESRLADVLEPSAPPRFYLSARAEASYQHPGQHSSSGDIAYSVKTTTGEWGSPERHDLTSEFGPPPHPDGVRAPDGLAGRAHDRGRVAATLNSGGNNGGFRTEPGEHLVATYGRGTDRGVRVTGQGGMTEDPLLPLGLDSHRYRCCGNGVVADVAEWLGWRLRALLEDMT
jgi:5-methylcytosine-specific restriction endonuclease McrA